MIEIDDTLISEEILENDFVCNLDACKGACCVEGDAGAPVEDEEVEILKRIYHKVAPYLSEQGRQAIEAQGTAIRGSDGEWETPLILRGQGRKRNRPLWYRTSLSRRQNRLEKTYFLSPLPYPS